METAESLEAARVILHGRPPDVVLLDLYLPDAPASSCSRTCAGAPETEVVVHDRPGLHPLGSGRDARGRCGLPDQAGGSGSSARDPGHVGRNADLRDEIDTLRGELRRLGRFGKIVGASPVMQTVYDRIERVAPTDTTVLITGETGTGKELAAHTLHELSRRSKKPSCR